jgi:hypothetical protein
MSDLQRGAKCVVFADDIPLRTLQSAEKQLESGKTEILTFEGLLGFDTGPGSVTINLTLAIPSTGPEFDFDAWANSQEYLKLQIGFGPNVYAQKGAVISYTEGKSGVDASPTMSVVWKGPKQPVQ